MREILFRGKRVGEGTWKYGSYVEQYGTTQIYLRNGADEDGFDCYHVEPETVGKYTGLTDKNGTKIFEGDICEITTFTYEDEDIQLVGKVCFKYSSFVFQGLKHPDDEVLFSSVCDFDTDVEVIGNIHDNPELIGGEANG